MPVELDQLLATFLDEAGEHLAALEEGLLRVGGGAADAEVLNAVFRAVHSIKGGSGVFGFHALTRLTHAMEQVLDRLRKGHLPVTRERIDLLLRAVDGLAGLIAAARQGEVETAAVPDGLVRELLATAGITTPMPGPAAREVARPVGPRDYEIRFAPRPELLADGTDPLLLLRNLAKRGELTHTSADTEAIPDLDALAPDRCYLSWRLRVRSEQGADELVAVFQFVADLCDLEVRELTRDPHLDALGEFEQAYSQLVRWLAGRCDAAFRTDALALPG